MKRTWRVWPAIMLLGMSLAGLGSVPALAGQTPGPALHVRSALPRLPLALSPKAEPKGAPSVLDSVFCTSAANCWAVGSFTSKGALLNQVLHWTGKKWFRVVVPSPGGTAPGDSSTLIAVRCTSAANCWAVGDFINGRVNLDEALHWTGKKWHLVTTPSPGGTSDGDFNDLFDVACTSAKSCWAVGTYGLTMLTPGGISNVFFNQALHWDGKKWNLVTTPEPGGMNAHHANILDGVRCGSEHNCWAVGTFGRVDTKTALRNEVLHWNGKRWTNVAVTNPGGTATGANNELAGLSCTSTTNCVAAGSFGNFRNKGVARNEILRWNGKKWLKVSTPDPGGSKPGSQNALFGINCSSPRDCWAVGGFGGTSIALAANEALHWNGTKWSLVKTPNPSGSGKGATNELNSVRCTTSANCWAVGEQHRSTQTDTVNEILHWNGAKWSA